MEEPRGGSGALDRAIAARSANDLSGAQCEIEELLRGDPRNADAWVQLGFIQSASGNDADARSAFGHALEIAPGYDDAKFGMAQLAYRSGDAENARHWLQQMNPDRMQDPEVATLNHAIAQSLRGARSWRADTSVSSSSLTSDLDPWREAAVSLTHRAGDTWIGGGIEYAQRFGDSDLFGEVRLARAWGSGSWGLALGGAPNARFKPESSGRVEFATSQQQDWALDGSLTFARYNAGWIDRLGLRATHALHDDFKASVQAIVVRDEADELLTGYAVGASWQPQGRPDFTMTWTDAPESSEGVTVIVRSLGLGIGLDVAPNLRVRVGALQEQRDVFDRFELSLSVARTF